MVLIVPSGIETMVERDRGMNSNIVLIVPSGIETNEILSLPVVTILY